jgi:hypothetical protein
MKESTALDFFKNPEYEEFIIDFEDKWLQYATAEERVSAFFGTRENALKLFNDWQKGIDLWSKQKAKVW